MAFYCRHRQSDLIKHSFHYCCFWRWVRVNFIDSLFFFVSLENTKNYKCLRFNRVPGKIIESFVWDDWIILFAIRWMYWIIRLQLLETTIEISWIIYKEMFRCFGNLNLWPKDSALEQCLFNNYSIVKILVKFVECQCGILLLMIPSYFVIFPKLYKYCSLMFILLNRLVCL